MEKIDSHQFGKSLKEDRNKRLVVVHTGTTNEFDDDTVLQFSTKSKSLNYYDSVDNESF